MLWEQTRPSLSVVARIVPLGSRRRLTARPRRSGATVQGTGRQTSSGAVRRSEDRPMKVLLRSSICRSPSRGARRRARC